MKNIELINRIRDPDTNIELLARVVRRMLEKEALPLGEQDDGSVDRQRVKTDGSMKRHTKQADR